MGHYTQSLRNPGMELPLFLPFLSPGAVLSLGHIPKSRISGVRRITLSGEDCVAAKGIFGTPGCPVLCAVLHEQRLPCRPACVSGDSGGRLGNQTAPPPHSDVAVGRPLCDSKRKVVRVNAATLATLNIKVDVSCAPAAASESGPMFAEESGALGRIFSTVERWVAALCVACSLSQSFLSLSRILLFYMYLDSFMSSRDS